MLALGIRYLRGVAVATDPGEYERAEWPPHPARVFMAMAAAHFEAGGDTEERAALEWLEAIPEPPGITAPQGLRREVVTRFVPVNDRAGPAKAVLQSAPGLTRNRAARVFPAARPDADSVFLIWKEASPLHHEEALRHICEKVSRIGHSSSLVQMWVEPEPPEPTWIPADNSASLLVRRMSPGLLRYLEECANADAIHEYAALDSEASAAKGRHRNELRERLAARFPRGGPVSLRPRISTWQGYARAGATPAEPLTGTVWDPEPIVLRMEALEGPARHLDLARTLELTRRAHEAVLASCPEPVPEYVSGHAGDAASERPHLAYLPLAFVGSTHADGLIRGLGVAMPRGLSSEEQRVALAAVAQVRELRMGRLGRWALHAEDRDPAPWTVDGRSWSGGRRGARSWASVTPVAFDRHPKARDPKARDEELRVTIASACRRIGLPDPESVVVTPVSAHLGAPAAHEFPRMRRKDGSLRRHSHAIVNFPEAVVGPVLLGAGRYRGYGLLRPLRTGEGL